MVRAEMEPLVLDTMTKFGDKQEVSMRVKGAEEEGRGRGNGSCCAKMMMSGKMRRLSGG